MLSYLPVLTTVVTVPFTILVFRRWARSRTNPALFFWGVGLIFYSTGAFTESLYSIFGWNESWGELNFRLFYLSGAILVAAWLGQGTVFFLWRRIAVATSIVLAVGSVYSVYAVFTAPLDPTLLIAGVSELTGIGVLPTGVRLLPLFFNLYGVVALVGGALWSALMYFRRRTEADRMIGNLLIAAGGILPGISGSLSRLGFDGRYPSELAGAALLFWGFIIVSRHVTSRSARSSAVSSVSSTT